LLQGEHTRLLVDCGLIQGEKFAHDLNRAAFPYDPASIEYLLVTHAHIDHIGRIPKLARDGFHGKIVSTSETLELSRLMLPDAFSVLRSETADNEELLYDEKDIAQAFSLWEAQPYHKTFSVGEFETRFANSGHILGSAMIELCSAEPADLRRQGVETRRKIVFTGDLGNSPTPLLKPAEVPTGATYLVMESVYGDRNHEGGERRNERLAEVIRSTVENKGTLLIPCFSLEKTQVLLSEMDELFEDKRMFDVPVFLDSPLAIKVTDVYRRYKNSLNKGAMQRLKDGDDIFSFKNLRLTMDHRASSEIERTPSPKIIIAGSGMSAGGRILDHERHYLGDPKNTILFIGYQAIGGLGRQIQEGVKHVHINHEDVQVRARIETISGYSSHMDSAHLQEFAGKAAENGTLEKVFVVMGEPRSALFLAQRVRDYNDVEAIVPEAGESVEIEL
jgi:metallo-beta-lactamase family protein